MKCRRFLRPHNTSENSWAIRSCFCRQTNATKISEININPDNNNCNQCDKFISPKKKSSRYSGKMRFYCKACLSISLAWPSTILMIISCMLLVISYLLSALKPPTFWKRWRFLVPLSRGKAGECPNPNGVETSFRAERDNVNQPILNSLGLGPFPGPSVVIVSTFRQIQFQTLSINFGIHQEKKSFCDALLYYLMYCIRCSFASYE